MVGKSIPLKQWKTSLDLKDLKVILVYRPSPKKIKNGTIILAERLKLWHWV
jgi:hypothetical protein